MTQKALLAVIALAAFAPSAHAAPNADLLNRIEKGCLKAAEGEHDKPALVCACVKRNYSLSAWTDEEVEVMARSYEMDSKAEAELQGEKYENLVLFDYDNTEGCLKNTKFRFKK